MNRKLMALVTAATLCMGASSASLASDGLNAAIGGGLGGAAGAVVGQMFGGDTGAIIGAGLGGAGGSVLADNYNDRHDDDRYARDSYRSHREQRGRSYGHREWRGHDGHGKHHGRH